MIELSPLTEPDRAAFARMVRAYLAEIAPGLPAVIADRIATPWKDPTREALLIRADDATRGFALLRRLPGGTREVSEFCIAPDARRSGLGTGAARAVLRRYPGRWQLGLAKGAIGAPAFWDHVLAPLARARRGPPATPHQTGTLHFTIEEPTP